MAQAREGLASSAEVLSVPYLESKAALSCNSIPKINSISKLQYQRQPGSYTIIYHGRGHCFLILQAFVLGADTEHLITRFTILWGMAINANMHQGVTWPYSNCGNTFHASMARRACNLYHSIHHVIRVTLVDPRNNLGSKFMSWGLFSESQFTPQIGYLNFLADWKYLQCFSYKRKNILEEKEILKCNGVA